MEDYVDDFALRVLRANKTARAIHDVEKCMHQYGITRPLTIERRTLSYDLPNDSYKREGDNECLKINVKISIKNWKLEEVLKRFQQSNVPKTEHEVARKLNDLFVYAEVGQALGSAQIALAVTKSLKQIKAEIPAPQNHGVLPRRTRSLNQKDSKRQISITVKSSNISDKVRDDLKKYQQVGEIKKKLYSMPEYVRDRDKKGVKLPENKLKSPSQQMNLNISKVRVSNTKIGRVIVKQKANRKKIDDLKHQLNPLGKNL